MDLTVALEARYTIAPDGSVWSPFGMARSFWQRYLEVFDTVKVVARATPVGQTPDGWEPVTGKNIVFHALPDYRGPGQYVLRYPSLRAAIRSATPSHGAVILRVGSPIANIMESALAGRNHPFALEVVGDPYEVFARGAINHPLRPFFRWHFSRRLRLQCLDAIAVAYVTKDQLQKRYPTRSMSMSISDVDLPPDAVLNPVFSTHFSSIELDSENIVSGIRKPKQSGPWQLVTVGSLAQLYKGPDVLIEAIGICLKAGLDLKAVMVGDGKYRPRLMAQAERAGLASRIEFAGHVPAGESVRRFLDAADLFVLPSRTEGLPRAMIEAMARSLPCIGSAVGGIPELLHPTEMVPPGDPVSLAAKIQEVLSDRSRMEALSKRNLERAREYSSSVLSRRRREFYKHVRDYTLDWERRTNPEFPRPSYRKTAVLSR